MTDKKVSIIWSDQAKLDLKYIHDRVLKKTKTPAYAKNVTSDIIKASKEINFITQYQVDEILGEPYRRMIVRHFKIIYKAESNTSIIILEIFDSYRNPLGVRK
ncbi:type II toxin-antitoxin system RelE/ParE family toxin [Wenyingzhuangia sp. IMCC45574]